jgi:hypothetical protein
MLYVLKLTDAIYNFTQNIRLQYCKIMFQTSVFLVSTVCCGMCQSVYFSKFFHKILLNYTNILRITNRCSVLDSVIHIWTALITINSILL